MQTHSPNTNLSVNFEAVEVYVILIFANFGGLCPFESMFDYHYHLFSIPEIHQSGYRTCHT
jgi:hypothetical protein